MIRLALPKELVPFSAQSVVSTPSYLGKEFWQMREITFVDLCGHLMDDAFEDDTFFIELSGNDFVKLIERDTLPSWATPKMLFDASTASGSVNPVTRKITWVKPTKN